MHSDPVYLIGRIPVRNTNVESPVKLGRFILVPCQKLTLDKSLFTRYQKHKVTHNWSLCMINVYLGGEGTNDDKDVEEEPGPEYDPINCIQTVR